MAFFDLNNPDMSVNGGFYNDNASQGGSASKKKDQVRRIQSVVPMFISYITECTDEEVTLFGMPVQMADIIGVLRNFDVQSTKATCVIEDQSGSIKAILWLETDNDSVNAIPPVKENCYVRVFGSIRTQDGEKMIMILKIIPVDDLNVITNHHFQVVHSRLYAEKLSSGDLSINGESSSTNNGPMSFADVKTDAQDNPHGLKPMQNKIMNLLKNSRDYLGVAMSDILGNFTPAEAKEVRNTMVFLLDEGYVYTTSDNEHFKATDGL